MPRFYLESVDCNDSVTTKEFECEVLFDVVDNVADFLRGSGFAFDELVVENDAD